MSDGEIPRGVDVAGGPHETTTRSVFVLRQSWVPSTLITSYGNPVDSVQPDDPSTYVPRPLPV